MFKYANHLGLQAMNRATNKSATLGSTLNIGRLKDPIEYSRQIAKGMMVDLVRAGEVLEGMVHGKSVNTSKGSGFGLLITTMLSALSAFGEDIEEHTPEEWKDLVANLRTAAGTINAFSAMRNSDDWDMLKVSKDMLLVSSALIMGKKPYANFVEEANEVLGGIGGLLINDDKQMIDNISYFIGGVGASQTLSKIFETNNTVNDIDTKENLAAFMSDIGQLPEAMRDLLSNRDDTPASVYRMKMWEHIKTINSIPIVGRMATTGYGQLVRTIDGLAQEAANDATYGAFKPDKSKLLTKAVMFATHIKYWEPDFFSKANRDKFRIVEVLRGLKGLRYKDADGFTAALLELAEKDPTARTIIWNLIRDGDTRTGYRKTFNSKKWNDTFYTYTDPKTGEMIMKIKGQVKIR